MPFKSLLDTSNIQLIHVDKCAGGRLKQVLYQNSICFKTHHSNERQPTYNANRKHIITARDPVDRLLAH